MSDVRASGYEAVFFDLDGTLVDTAPDMVAVLTNLQAEEGVETLDYELARSHVSNGAAGLVNLAFPDVDARNHERLRLRYLEKYQQRVCVDSALFAGLDELLDALDEASRPWGIVTNKPMRMTEPLLAGLGLAERSACSISGDTLAQRKPDPAPLILACEQAEVSPNNSIYVGDAARDIEAGRAAGMVTVAAAYGYINDDDPFGWGADLVVADTLELTTYLSKAVNLGA
jgi:2-phosphoglycolate phosphatase